MYNEALPIESLPVKMLLIATIFVSNKINKYRLLRLDANYHSIYDVTEDILVKAIINKKVTIENTKVEHNKIRWCGASLTRYARLDTSGNLLSESPVVIIDKIIKNNTIIGYRVSGYKGGIVALSLNDTINYVVKHGIANGKLVRKNEKYSIVPIIGKFESIDVSNMVSELKSTIEKPNINKVDNLNKICSNLAIGRNITIPLSTLYSAKSEERVSTKEAIDNGIIEIVNSFRNSQFDNTNIIIGKGIERIDHSYIDSNITSLKAESGSKLKCIRNSSFSDCKDLKFVDLSNCKSLESIGDHVFYNCPNLEKVILPDNLKQLGHSTFGNCDNLSTLNMPSELIKIEDTTFYSYKGNKIEKITINKELKTVPRNLINTTIIFENRKCLNKDMLSYVKCKEVILPNSLSVLSHASLESGKFEFNIPSNLTEIHERAFYNFHSDRVLDLSGCNNLKILGTQAFSCSEFKEIYLPESVETIERDCFSYASNLRFLYIPKTVKNLGEKALFNAGQLIPGGVIVLTQRGSVVEGYCKSHGIKVIHAENVQDAIQISKQNFEVTKISDKKKAKLRMILSADDVHSELLSDEYIDMAESLYNTYTNISSRYDENDIELDKSKFRHIKIREAVPNDKIDDFKLSESKLNYEECYFISKCNYITNCFTDYTHLFENKEFIQSFYNVSIVYRLNNLGFKFNDYELISFEIKMCDERFLMIVLVNKGYIEFCTILNVNAKQPSIIQNILKADCTTIINKPIHRFMDNETLYPLTSEYCFRMPDYIKYKIVETMHIQFTLIGYESEIKEGKDRVVYFLNFITGDICKFKAVLVNQKEQITMRDIVGVQYIEHFYPSELRNHSKGIVLDNENDGMAKIIELISNINKVKSLTHVEKLNPCLEWEISYKLNNSNITTNSLDKLDINTIKDIFNTSWFIKYNKKPKALYKFSEQVLLKTKDITISEFSIPKRMVSFKYTDRLEKLPDFRIKSDVVKFTIITFTNDSENKSMNNSENKSMISGYLSSIGFIEIFEMLLNIYSKHSNDKNELVRDKINISDYYILYKYREDRNLVIGEIEYIALAIGKSTGAAKILAIKENANANNKIIDAYELLRIKDFNRVFKSNIINTYDRYKNTRLFYIIEAEEEEKSKANKDNLARIMRINVDLIIKAREIQLLGYNSILDFPGNLGELVKLTK